MIARLSASLAAWRHRLGEFWWYAVLLFAVQATGMLVNFYTGLWLIPRVVPQADLGAILPLLQIAAFLAVPLTLLLTPVGKFLNTFMARGEAGKAKALLIDACRVSLVAAVVMAAYTVVVAPFVQLRMHVAGAGIVALLCATAFMNGIRPVIASSTQALKRFNMMLFGGLVGAPLRFVLVWLLAGAFGLVGYLGALVGLELAGLLIAAYSLHQLLGTHVRRDSYRGHGREMLSFSLPLVISGIFGSLAATVLPFVIRHRLPEVESAAYYILTRFGEISGYVGMTVITLLFPLVSERHERGLSANRLLWQASVANAVGGGLVVLAFAWGGHLILGQRPQWAICQQHSDLMWRLGLVRLLEMVVAAFYAYEIACRRFGLMWSLMAVDLVMALLLYNLVGWGVFRPYLPPTWWETVNALNPCRLDFIVNFALAGQLIRLPVLAAAMFHGKMRRKDQS